MREEINFLSGEKGHLILITWIFNNSLILYREMRFKSSHNADSPF